MSLNTEKREVERKRGADASYILEHPLYVESVTSIRERLMKNWQESPVRDTEGREKIWMMLTMLNEIEANFRSMVQTGKLASSQLASAKQKGDE